LKVDLSILQRSRHSWAPERREIHYEKYAQKESHTKDEVRRKVEVIQNGHSNLAEGGVNDATVQTEEVGGDRRCAGVDIVKAGDEYCRFASYGRDQNMSRSTDDLGRTHILLEMDASFAVKSCSLQGQE
jgi:hypothetical protein